MKENTPRDFLDAVQRGMEKTWRHIDQKKAEEARQAPQARRLRDNAKGKDSDWRRGDQD